MKYIVLLRGVNISGKNKLAMKALKDELEKHQYSNVITYLNSGNVIVESDNDKSTISDHISLIIKEKFDLDVPVYITTSSELKDLLEHHPNWWGTDDKEIYDNIIFIMPPAKFKDLYDAIGDPTKDIERIQEYHNSVFWSFDLNNYRKANWWKKTASTNIKDQITIRTANTMRKVLKICDL